MLRAKGVDCVVLAGFMRLVTPVLLDAFKNRVVNIHPALLPDFKGLDTHKRVIDAGVKIHGATVHFVVPELDSGPVIAQGAVNVRPGDSEEALAVRVLKVEHRIYPLALKLVAEGRVQIKNNHTLIDGVPVPNVADLAPTDPI